MNTNQINKILFQNVPNVFKGTYPSDMLPKQQFESYPAAIVANTDPSDKSGAHWVALYFPTSNKAEYFCSYANPPSQVFLKCLRGGGGYDRIKVNPTRVQGDLSAVCGQYSVYFILKRDQ